MHRMNVSVVWLLSGDGEGVAEAPGEEMETEVRPDLAGVLVEMRDVRAKMKSSLDHLARLEKKLRTMMNEAASDD